MQQQHSIDPWLATPPTATILASLPALPTMPLATSLYGVLLYRAFLLARAQSL